ncbi:hypothetical protein CMQ_1869 [Grosmannia clavigera kw1407]|uniref:Uncharacterized protein n=1 Tax=Grosmannia clavigera (strain kw1407 / UAMH 11150) TaxID=655863 RepID=F0XNE2_GROCL|nr:uncharacterized protein CMQ_1869 [Grosmannia clavigera kw1407]EFX00788.1 hypothetical protein CMQ_1869 [Grosmannia clavigera kw1407]
MHATATQSLSRRFAESPDFRPDAHSLTRGFDRTQLRGRPAEPTQAHQTASSAHLQSDEAAQQNGVLHSDTHCPIPRDKLDVPQNMHVPSMAHSCSTPVLPPVSGLGT